MKILSIFEGVKKYNSDISLVSLLMRKLNDKNSMLIIVLFSLLCFVPGIYRISAIDREETRVVLTSQQMMEDDNYFDIHETGSLYRLKLGTHWLQVAAAKLIGSGPSSPIWVYRLPSLFGAIIATVVLFWCVRAFTSTPVALLATLLTSSTALLAVASRMSNSDALFLLCIVIAHSALVRIWLSEETQKIVQHVSTFWLAVSACMLIDGPFGPMMMILTISSLSIGTRKFSWIRRLRPILGLFLSLIITLPWIAISNMELEGGFNTITFIKDIFGKFGHGIDHEGALPLTHLLMMQLTFWPLSTFFVIAIPYILRNKGVPKLFFFLAWAITTWILLELVAFKPPNIMISILPAVATLTAIALTSCENGWRIGRWIGSVLMIIVPIIFIVLVVGAPIYFDDNMSPLGIFFCCCGFLLALFSAHRILMRRGLIPSIAAALFAAVFLNVGFFGMAVPNLTSLKFNELLGKKIFDVTMCSNPSVGTVGYKEPSLEFYVGKHINFDLLEQAVSWINTPGCKLLIVQERQLEKFEDLVRNHYNKPSMKSTISGLNYNQFEILKFHIFQKNIIGY